MLPVTRASLEPASDNAHTVLAAAAALRRAAGPSTRASVNSCKRLCGPGEAARRLITAGRAPVALRSAGGHSASISSGPALRSAPGRRLARWRIRRPLATYCHLLKVTSKREFVFRFLRRDP